MSNGKEELRAKLLEMYPEIDRYGLSLDLEFDDAKNAWVVSFSKGNLERHAFLDKEDADACVQGQACVYLGVLIAQYIRAMEAHVAG
jgi:hypothetical protein